MIAAGRLRERLALLSPTTTGDGRGGRATTWTTARTVWASVQPLSGREQIHADRLVTGVTHVAILRRTSQTTAVDATWRASWDDTTFEIARIADVPESDRSLLQLELKETAT